MVLDTFIAEGGEYKQLSVKPGVFKSDSLQNIILSDGQNFLPINTCSHAGPGWQNFSRKCLASSSNRLGSQCIILVLPPAHRFLEDRLPVWVDFGERIFYGIPGDGRRGFKMADDTRGEPIEPTSDERKPSHEGFEVARKYIEFRLPGLKGARC